MSGSISFNPYTTSQPQDSFLLQSQGYVQGAVYDDTSIRMELERGTLASTETVVMWGGIPVTELINNAGANGDGLGPTLKRATTQTNLTGFSTYNQAGSMVIGPGQTAPVSGVGSYVGFFRLQTGIKMAVQCDPALIAAISGAGDAVNSQALYWDVTNYRITLTTTGGNFALPTSIRLLSTNTNSKIVSYNSGTGAVTWAAGDAAMILI